MNRVAPGAVKPKLNRSISRKGAKHALSKVERDAKEIRIVISTEGRNLSQIPRIPLGMTDRGPSLCELSVLAGEILPLEF